MHYEKRTAKSYTYLGCGTHENIVVSVEAAPIIRIKDGIYGVCFGLSLFYLNLFYFEWVWFKHRRPLTASLEYD